MRAHARTPGPAPPTSAETKRRLLDAAERLFAERGFQGASLRAITRTAGVSVSAANYHFGSKESLLRATLRRRVEPVIQRRLERLDAVEAAAGDRPPPLESILEAFVIPTLEARTASLDGAARYRQVAARLFADPPELVAALARELFGPINERFTSALARALPDRDPDAVATAFHFTVGVVVHLIGGHLDAGPGGDGPLGRLSGGELSERMVSYAAAGLRAAPTREAAADAPGEAGR